MGNNKQKVIMKFKDDKFVSQLTALLLQTGKVKVTGLGIFEIKKTPKRNATNIFTKEIMVLPERNRIFFRFSKSFKNAVVKDYD